MTERSQIKRRTYEGLPVHDAPAGTTLTFAVSKRNVQAAKSNDPANCAAALAAKSDFKTDVRVHLSRTYVKKGKKWIRFATPERISREIVSFDRGHTFAPGEYTIRACSASNRLGVEKWESTRTGEGYTRKRSHRLTVDVRRSARDSQAVR